MKKIILISFLLCLASCDDGGARNRGSAVGDFIKKPISKANEVSDQGEERANELNNALEEFND